MRYKIKSRKEQILPPAAAVAVAVAAAVIHLRDSDLIFQHINQLNNKKFIHNWFIV